VGGERTRVVGVARIGVGVANEEDEHAASIAPVPH
jgi:hypothetical protein